jgi:hypothetical protein
MKTTGSTTRFQTFKAALRHAFAVGTVGQPLTAEEQVLLEKVATTIVNRGMASPAVLFLESAGPMNFLGSQALHFLAPILDLACDAREIEQAARLLERRDAIPRLIELIEAKSAPAKSTPDGASAR